jgi:multisubunit Na+/H+ antiporter MnhB subunit
MSSDEFSYTRSSRERIPLWQRLLTEFLLLLLFAALILALVSLPEQAEGLKAVVGGEMARSGVTHPVTAVLINFRGYDTLLEMAVLLLALIGVRSLTPSAELRLERPGMVLERLAQLYGPLMVLVAGYLLWRGAAAPGGAFQAGSVLGAAGVLMLLAGRQLDARMQGWPLRLLVTLGLAVFTLVAASLLLSTGSLLRFPPAYASSLILLIEAAATLSIGATLAALFLGGQHGGSS